MLARRYHHRIEAPLPAVEEAVLDPDTLPVLAARLPEVGEARELERDLEELPQEVLDAITFHPVERVEQVWELALTRPVDSK